MNGVADWRSVPAASHTSLYTTMVCTVPGCSVPPPAHPEWRGHRQKKKVGASLFVRKAME
jgi:hypothetical protein